MGYLRGVVSKEDFAAALRAHQAAVDATKSPGRDTAETARGGQNAHLMRIWKLPLSSLDSLTKSTATAL
eukprot:scaffold3121_cov211-Skeletonema_marinoi.AAC.6